MASFRYDNLSSRTLILKLSDSGWERTLFPGQSVSFSASAKAQLEIYTSEWASCILEERIPCARLELEVTTPSRTPVSRPTSKVAVLSAA